MTHQFSREKKQIERKEKRQENDGTSFVYGGTMVAINSGRCLLLLSLYFPRSNIANDSHTRSAQQISRWLNTENVQLNIEAIVLTQL